VAALGCHHAGRAFRCWRRGRTTWERGVRWFSGRASGSRRRTCRLESVSPATSSARGNSAFSSGKGRLRNGTPWTSRTPCGSSSTERLGPVRRKSWSNRWPIRAIRSPACERSSRRRMRTSRRAWTISTIRFNLVARNLGAADARVELAVYNAKPPSFYVYLNYLSADGFSPTGVLKGGETTHALNVSRVLAGRSVLNFKPAADRETDVEVRFYADPAATRELRTLRLKGNPAPNDTMIATLRPDGALGLATTEDLINSDLETLRTALKDDPRPVPKRSYVACSVSDAGEALETYRSEIEIVRLVGANAATLLGRLEKERKELGSSITGRRISSPGGRTGFRSVDRQDLCAGRLRPKARGRRGDHVLG